MNRFARWGLTLALLPLAACASNPPPAPPAAPSVPPPLSAADASFVQMAAQGGMAEIQMGQLADSTSKSKVVKAYAEQMIKDHTTANDQLKQIATAKGAVLPTGVNDEQQKTMTMLQGEKGRKFDHDYIASQVEDHTTMVSTFQTESTSSSDPDLKNFAATTLPIVQEHLTEAQKLAAPTSHKMMHHHHKHVAS